jgi:hypothetical protein
VTYIEFLDRTISENLCASLINVPERVVLVGNSEKLLNKHKKRYQRLFEKRGHTVDFDVCEIKQYQMQTIVDALSKIVETYADCVFDLTGGDDLYLMAMGIVSERYKERNVQMHRYNISSHTIVDCDQDGTTIQEKEHPVLTVEENILVHGGDIIWQSEKNPEGTVRWEDTPELRHTLQEILAVQPKEPGLWNKQVDTLQAAFHLTEETDDPLTACVKISALKWYMDENKMGYLVNSGLMSAMYNKGLLVSWSKDNGELRVTCRDELVKYFLTKAGRFLEMRVYLAALDAREDGLPHYNDVLTGVNIDWDGDVHGDGEAVETKNEIDVMLMRGVVPVFVSCKNGGVKMEELYKLATVAQRFGGRYARKVLVVSKLDERKPANQYLVKRAEDMGIRVVKNAGTLSDAALIRETCKFC